MKHAAVLSICLALPAAITVPALALVNGNGLIFAAASLKGPLDQAVQRLIRQDRCVADGRTIRVSYASSGILARQIRFGAPADLFITADARWLDDLQKRGKLAAAARRVLYTNRLVMIAPGDKGAAPTSIPELKSGTAAASGLGRQRLAIGDPAHVPAGRFAKEALKSLGLWDQARRRIVFAANVRVALAYVARGAAPLGLVYATDAKAEKQVRIVAQVPAAAHAPIRYIGAAIRTGNGDGGSDCGKQWLRALQQPAYRKLFVDAGYGVPAE